MTCQCLLSSGSPAGMGREIMLLTLTDKLKNTSEFKKKKKKKANERKWD